MQDAQSNSLLLERNYDGENRIIKQTDANGTYTEYTYDELSRYTSVCAYSEDGKLIDKKSLSYDEAYDYCGMPSLMLTVTEGCDEKRRTDYVFDRNENVLEKIVYSGDEKRHYSYRYDHADNLVYEKTPLGAETHYSYDIFGNNTHVNKPNGTQISFEYDFNGNCTAEINALGEKRTTEYDALSRKISDTTYDGQNYNTNRFFYDACGNMTLTEDPAGKRTEYVYNSQSKPIVYREYSAPCSGTEVEYDYDGEGNILSTSYGAIGSSKRRTYTNILDVYGRTVKTIDPLGAETHFEYDVLSNITKKIDPNGVCDEYEYDAAGQLKRRINSKDGTTEYTYNDFGQRLSVTDSTSSKTYVYNGFGETVRIADGYTVHEYSYDQDGNMTNHTVSDKDMEQIEYTYGYDKSGKLVSAATPMGTDIMEYDAAERLKSKKNTQSGMEKEYMYYPNDVIREVRARRDGKLMFYEKYQYDASGNKVYSDENGRIRKYSYDGMNRLTGMSDGDDTRIEYEFDDYGNISREYELIGTNVYTKSYYYDGNNHLLLSDSDTETVQYEYDNAGNLIKKITGIGDNAETARYTYDGSNRIKTYADMSAYAEYEYDTDGLRSTKTVNGEKTRYVYDNGNIIGEIFGDTINEYARGTEIIGMRNNKGDRYYYEQNSHGDVLAIADEFGEIKKSYTYDAYGKEQLFNITPQGENTLTLVWKAETERIYNPFRYCGEYADSETGMIYLRNRYYDPNIGRFITEDPAEDGLNWYVYCGGNPIMYVDPSGLREMADDKLGMNRLNNNLVSYYTEKYNEVKNDTSLSVKKKYLRMNNYRRYTVAIRRKYNSNYVDNYDYTYGG